MKNIGFDIDGVIAEWHSEFLRLAREDGIDLSYENWLIHEIEEFLPLDFDKIIELFNKINISKLSIAEGASDTIFRLAKDGYNICFITHRPSLFHETTIEWLKRHSLDFPVVFSKYKARECKQRDIKVFVEDHPYHAYKIAKLDIFSILLDRPWNEDIIASNIKRLYPPYWDEVESLIRNVC